MSGIYRGAAKPTLFKTHICSFVLYNWGLSGRSASVSEFLRDAPPPFWRLESLHAKPERLRSWSYRHTPWNQSFSSTKYCQLQIPFPRNRVEYSAALLEFSRIWPTYFRCWCFFNFWLRIFTLWDQIHPITRKYENSIDDKSHRKPPWKKHRAGEWISHTYVPSCTHTVHVR